MSNVNLIFIDIDGVLNSENFYHNEPNFTWDLFDPTCVLLLNKLIEKTDALLVLSSDWRKTYGIYEVKKIFKQNKVEGIIVGSTPIINKRGLAIQNCGLEIEMYLKSLSKKVKEQINYIILDDIYLFLNEQMNNNFVHINPIYGFSFKDYEKASNILKQ